MQKSMFRQMVESKLNASLNKMQEETIQSPEETIQELKDIIKRREDDIKVLQIQKEDKKKNLIYTLEDQLQIRYKDYINCKRQYESGKMSDETYIMCLDITLGKVFGILKNNGITFKEV